MSKITVTISLDGHDEKANKQLHYSERVEFSPKTTLEEIQSIALQRAKDMEEKVNVEVRMIQTSMKAVKHDEKLKYIL